ncbi:MAG: hypothetical protein LBI05_02955 [Planctomycetaceae bacterium]|jgi:hypothetical protein|nr:hypothetical protein [Planctomycetaceae bacterium]
MVNTQTKRVVAFVDPVSPDYANDRGIDKTDWIPIDRTLYDQAIDPTNYRSR